MNFRHQYFLRRNLQFIVFSLGLALALFPVKVLSHYLNDRSMSTDNVQRTSQNIAEKQYYDILLEADELYQKSDFEKARKLYKTVKQSIPEPKLVNKPIYETNLEKLSGREYPVKLKVYWREALEGFEKNRYGPIFTSLRLLIREYPEFVPAYLKLVEACKTYPEPCDSKNYAKDDEPRTIINILEQATTLYPYDTDLLKAKIEALDEFKDYSGASIAARQFSILYSDYEEASEFKSLADEYAKKHIKQIKRQVFTKSIGKTIIDIGIGVLTENPRYGVSALQTLKLLFLGEENFGKNAATAFIFDYKENEQLRDDQMLQNYVEGIGGQFIPFVGRDDLEFEFYIVEDNSLNAFVLPGGKIFINTGAILAANSEAELAGIIAHEVAHAALSHGYLKLSTSLVSESLSQIVPFLDLVSGIVNSKYSRDQETQADILGTRLLSQADYAADGMRNFLATLNEKGGDQKTTLLSTHPAPSERIQYLEKLIVDGGYNIYSYEGVKSHRDIQNYINGVNVEKEPKPDKSNLDGGKNRN